MQNASKKPTFGTPSGEPAKRYERTLKERLAAGEVIRHWCGKFEAATMRKSGNDIVMSGFTGTHRIDFQLSGAGRIEAHWNGFCYMADKARRQVRSGARR